MALVHFDFPAKFRTLYKKGFQLYQDGQRGAEHLYDYAEDDVSDGQPGFGNALTIEAVRRDYFLSVQNGIASSVVADPADWPGKSVEVEGMSWLPRIIPKAKAKLRGELPASMMYSCGGDRAFFHRHNILPAEFLNLIWRHLDDDQAIVDWVKARSAA